MSGTNRQDAEGRQQPRLKLAAMYTLLRARPAGTRRYRWIGHIYDISSSGMRFELDCAVDPGTELEVRGLLPGTSQTTFRATGRVVRLHDDEDGDPGPVRMGMTFSKFQSGADEQRLGIYLSDRGIAA